MKRSLLLLAMLVAFKFSYAQWSGTNPVTTSSNVGIGTTNPTEALSVDGGANHGKIYTAVPFADAILKMYRWTGTGTSYYPWYLATGRPNGGFSIMYGSPANVGSETNMIDALFIGNNGYVGVGTTSPIGNLDVRGNFFVGSSDFVIGSTGSNIQIDQGSSTGNSYSRIRAFSHGGTQVDNLALQSSGGNVGIGTTAPAEKLEINGNVKLTGSGWYQAGVANWFGSANNLSNSTAAASDLGLRTDGNLIFMNYGGNEHSRFDTNGNLGLGTTDTKGYKLAVNGSIIATSIKVKSYANWPDYVFKPTYALRPLSEVKTYIDQNQHLPEVPAATTVEKEGMDVGEMNKILLKKVEELTLYLIEKDQKDKKQQEQIDKLTQEVNSLKSKIDRE